MKNNWKEEFKALFNSYGEDERYADLFYDFIESLLAEQKKELIDLLLSKGEDNQNCYEGCYRDWVTKIQSLKHHD